MRRLAVVVAAVVVAVACSEAIPTQEVTGDGTGLQMLYEPPPGKCMIWTPNWQNPSGNNGCSSTSATGSPTNWFCAHQNSCAVLQTQPVSYVFSKPVYSVDVDGFGSFYCNSTDHGTIYFYSRGKVVEVGHPAIYLQAQMCAPDGTSYGDDSLAQEVVYQSIYQGPIDSIVITKPTPDSLVQYWPPFRNEAENTNSVAQISATYAFFLREQPDDQATTCLTNDPTLNRQVIRDLFRALWDSSGTGLPAAQRRETGAWVYEDTATGGLITVQQPFNPTTDNACHSEYAPTTSVGIPLFHVHTHPFLRGEVAPQYCWAPGTPPSRPGIYDPLTFGGPSKDDLNNLVANGNLFPEYIVDSSNVYAVPANATLRNSRGVTKSFARHKSSPFCDLF